MRHYLGSDLNRILQSLYYFFQSLFRSHPTFPLINLVRLLLFSFSVNVNAETVL